VRLGRSRDDRVRQQRARLAKEGYEGSDPIPVAPSGRPMVDVRCFKCGAKLAEVERAGDVIVVAPDEVEIHFEPPRPGMFIVQCRRCRERRAVMNQPIRPPRRNGGP
jgi:ribosomal protein S27E